MWRVYGAWNNHKSTYVHLYSIANKVQTKLRNLHQTSSTPNHEDDHLEGVYKIQYNMGG